MAERDIVHKLVAINVASRKKRSLGIIGLIARRVWHSGGGSAFPILAFFLPRTILLALIGLTAAVFLVGELIRFALPEANKLVRLLFSSAMKRHERTHVLASTYLLIATLLAFLAFDRDVAITALLFVAFGDPMAAAVGERYGKRKIFNKSLEGSLACLLSCIVIGVLLSQFTPISLGIWVIIIGAAAATIAELIPLWLDDNLVVPVISAGALSLAIISL